MRDLTLDEKISIKGKLAKFGVQVPSLGMEHACWMYPRCTGHSVALFYKDPDLTSKRWRKRNGNSNLLP